MAAYVQALQTGTVAVASAAADGALGDGSAAEIVILDDGRYVAFSSTATNLVSDTLDTGAHIFHKDLQTGAVTLVRMPDGPAPAPAPAPFGFRTHSLSISVVFGSKRHQQAGHTHSCRLMAFIALME